jgi:hypothetical protein
VLNARIVHRACGACPRWPRCAMSAAAGRASPEVCHGGRVTLSRWAVSTCRMLLRRRLGRQLALHAAFHQVGPGLGSVFSYAVTRYRLEVDPG